MSRTARRVGEHDCYHVIVRGAGKQVIFEDDHDRQAFLDRLTRRMGEGGADLLAWCLMNNHSHLLMRAPIQDISRIMRDFESGYAGYFNVRHGHVGPVFQGRFHSVAIEDDRQLLAALRYIHRNPLEAGLELDNEWSSYREYVGAAALRLCDTGFALGVLGGRDAFVALHQREGDDVEYKTGEPRSRLNDERAICAAREVLGGMDPLALKSLGKADRNAQLARLRAAGLSARQVARLTGIGENIVARAK